MDAATLSKMMAEINLADNTAMETRIKEASVGTIYENAAMTKNSVFFNLMMILFKEPYQLFLQAVEALLPQLFVSSATGTWLERFAADYNLTRSLGSKARLWVRVTKTSGSPLEITTSHLFSVFEANPRTYAPIQNYNFDAQTTQCDLLVEALEIGQKYNLLNNQITQVSGGLNVLTIANFATEAAGTDVETDLELRTRILNKKWSQTLDYGIEAKYLAALLSVPDVDFALLDSVNPVTATLHFTLYGAGLNSGHITLANAALTPVLMVTDLAVVELATPEPLTVSIQLFVAHPPALETKIVNAVGDYFATMPRGQNFDESLLVYHLYSNVPELAGSPIHLTPETAILPLGKYFSPTVEFLP